MLEIRKIRKSEISKKPVWGQEIWMDSAVSYTGFIYMGQDNTNLHEILTDIAAKRKPRRGDFANGVLNSFFERKQ